MNDYKMWMKSIEIVSLALIVIGALNWGLVGAFDLNVVSSIACRTFASVEPAVYILIGVAALFHIVSRDYYLPFLGEAAYPCGALARKEPRDADTSVTVHVEPNVNVIYWAAEVNDKVQANPWVAYDEYTNAGVTRSDATGKAVMIFRMPSAYKVHSVFKNTTLKPHVHYRTCKNSGMVGRVETIFL